MLNTKPLLVDTDFPPIRRGRLDTLQVNLGYLCNQQCQHCHVNAGPRRKEIMALDTVEQVVDYLRRAPVKTLDLTGGAPEMNPHFRYLVSRARELGVKVIDRCNLTVLFEEDQDGLAEFLAGQQVEVVASLPCYSSDNVDAQRGKGVFDASIRGLQLLNSLGYGQSGSDLQLNLVFNPLGPNLPPDEQALEAEYRRFLGDSFGIEFNRLYAIANMPIKRFGSMLVSKGEFEPYMNRLREAYNPAALQAVMCRSLVSVDWQGRLYDCDFNQMLGLEAALGSRAHISTLDPDSIVHAQVRVAEHCYACTAGNGSSCGGATVGPDSE